MKHVELKPTCPVCGEEFAYRSNKKYCSKKCSRHATRQKQNKEESFVKYWDMKRLLDKNYRLAELYYKTPLPERPSFLVSLIRLGLEGDGRVKELLTSEFFLRADPVKEGYKCFGGRPTLAQEAHKLCMGSLGYGIGKLFEVREGGFIKLEAASPAQLLEVMTPPPAPKPPVMYIPEDMGPLAMRAYVVMLEFAGVTVTPITAAEQLETAPPLSKGVPMIHSFSITETKKE